MLCHGFVREEKFEFDGENYNENFNIKWITGNKWDSGN